MKKKASNNLSHVLLRTNKRALTGIEQVLLLTLIILTLAAVFFMFYKGDILTKIRNLPSYGQTASQGDEYIGTDEITESEFCPVKIGNVKGDYLTTQGEINFCQDLVKQVNCDGDLYAHLKLSGQKVQIERTEWYMWGFDTTVGSFNQNKISLMSELLDVNSKEYKILSGEDYYRFEDLPLLLKNLDGAWIVGNDICRDELIGLEVNQVK